MGSGRANARLSRVALDGLLYEQDSLRSPVLARAQSQRLQGSDFKLDKLANFQMVGEGLPGGARIDVDELSKLVNVCSLEEVVAKCG